MIPAHIDSVAPPGGQREAFEADMLRTYWNHATKTQDYANVAVQAMWQASRGEAYPPFVELLKPTEGEKAIRGALAVHCAYRADTDTWSYNTESWRRATYPGYADAMVRTIDGLRASLAPVHAPRASAMRLPADYSAMECRLAFDWLQSLAQQPDAPPFAKVALAAWHALSTASTQA